MRLTLSSSEWWTALHERFNVTQRKSFTLQPPPAELRDDTAMCWHYVRGYFDGDGGISRANVDRQGRVKQIDFTSGSRVFVEWLREFMGSHHKIGAVGRVWRLSISGKVMRCVIPRMYADTTIDTRLERKYKLLQPWLRLSL